MNRSTPGLPSITNSRSLLKLMSTELVMPFSHLILCRPLLLLPPIPPSIRVFSNESTLQIRWPKYWSFSLSISPSNEHPWLISFRMDWLDLLAVQGTLKSLLQHHSSKASILQCSSFFMVQLSHPYMTIGKTIALTRWTFVGKLTSLLFRIPSWLQKTGKCDAAAWWSQQGSHLLWPHSTRAPVLTLDGGPTLLMVRSPPGARVPPGSTLKTPEAPSSLVVRGCPALSSAGPWPSPLGSHQPLPRLPLSALKPLLTPQLPRLTSPTGSGGPACPLPSFPRHSHPSWQMLERQGSGSTFGIFALAPVTFHGASHPGLHPAAPRGQNSARSPLQSLWSAGHPEA